MGADGLTARRGLCVVGQVWFGNEMGLLDDAIREHLELKRLRGADPGRVAHEEREALGPVRRDAGAEDDGHDEQQDAPSDADGSFFSGSESGPASELSEAGQETVEINMAAELDKGRGAGHGERASGVRQTHAQARAEESLEWEVPSDRADEPADVAGQTGVDSPFDGDSAAGEHVEDVLEETPDFLRETPEQERLWFEQRPPRDFDFNE